MEHPGVRRLKEFVEYGEKQAKESEFGISPDKADHIMGEFEKLRTWAERALSPDEADKIFDELEFLEGKLKATLAAATSKYGLHFQKVKCEELERTVQELERRIKLLEAIIGILITIGTIAKLFL